MNENITKYVLKEKIRKFFSENKSAKVAYFSATIGEAKFHRKVVKESGGFNIFEVLAKEDNYIFEADDTEQEGEPAEEPADNSDVGIDTDPKEPEEPAPEEEKPEAPETMEIDRFSKALAGQTIKNADIELTPRGGEVTLDLAGAENPAKLTWDANGRVVFNFKGQPYFLRSAK